MSTPVKLEARSFPLRGSRLIEASAGTGKTWTIASLYVRLVLGHGGESGFNRVLAPAEILVMTFTRAATRELSERIRNRMIEVSRHFRAESGLKPPDDFILSLMQDYPAGPARVHAAWRLETAAAAMDDAAIMTIDAWCQRMLNEHAFDTGNPFDETLLAQDGPLIQEAIQDYWRQHCYPLAGDALEAVCSLWKDVDALADSVTPLLRRTLVWAADTRSLSECVEPLIAAEKEKLIELKQGWVERAQAIRDWYKDEVLPKSKPWNRRSLRRDSIEDWTGSIERWAADPAMKEIGLKPAAIKRLKPEGIREAYNDDASALTLPSIFEEFAELDAALRELKGPDSALRAHAASRIVERLKIIKRQTRSFSFADMTDRLERALTGPGGGRLRDRILAQYPVVLIDEFQDTSPEQYRLFDALYRCADNDPGTAIVLIGDPKQSIYGFRGADIHSYLKARSACAGRIHALDMNRRSTPAMVEAVNAWFGQAETRTDPEPLRENSDGAFRFRGQSDNPIPFIDVGAKGRPEQFRDGNGPIPALTVQHDLRLTASRRSMHAFAARCSERIVAWLNDEQVGFVEADDRFTRLRPADIAVLVRDRHEAAAVRRALRLRGVPSIFQSEQESVFASQEADDLLRWLRAVAMPGDSPLVRAALATRTLDLSFDALRAIAEDDEAYDQAAEKVRDLQAVWKQRGVLAMLRRTLHEFDCAARWLSRPDGERRLTNLLHLAELLQEASVEAEGDQALVQWLASRIEAAEDGASDEQVLRLESDADLVQIITIHKSKGLEYPVVFLPFACSYRKIDKQRKPGFVMQVGPTGERELKLDYDEADLERADIDRLREDLRLFYVALTRARHAVWMGFSSLRKGNANECQTFLSAPGWLLAGAEKVSQAQWLTPLERLRDRTARERSDPSDPSRIVLEPAPAELAFTRLHRVETLPALASAPTYTATFERRWTVGSYTSLTRDVAGSPLAPAFTRQPADDERAIGAEPRGERALTDLPAPPEPPATRTELRPATPPLERGWHRFPGGTRGGDFVHKVLERLAAEQFELAGKPWLEQALRDRCQRSDFSEHADDLVEWMHTLLTTELPSVHAPLSRLNFAISEMEFWMPVSSLQARTLDRLCCQRLLSGCERPALPERTLNGMLMGFADLVFEQGGRYWVLDYKTNRPRPAGSGRAGDQPIYDRASLESEMARHRYDVQAVVYLLALHRQLRARLGASYDPTRQLGGAIYWFIRGIDGPERGEYAIAADGGVLDLLEDLDQVLGGVEEART